MAMTSFDFTPLFRSTVGFDRLTRLLESRLDEGAVSYPPYNIEQTGEDSYRIVMAVAGFGEGDLSITQQANTLFISGKQEKPADEKKYLYRGIAARAFERRLELADHIKVTGANLTNGVLSIDLVREVPEAMKPRQIKIGGNGSAKVIENKAA
jgi:molecular chaperone IbpA